MECVEAAVHAKVWMVVALFSAVSADGAHFCCEGIVIGEEGSAVAVATEGLGREKAGGADV